MIKRNFLNGAALALMLAFGVSWSQTSLTASEAAMARAQGVDPSTMSAEQLQQARSALGGRDPSSLSASEIAAAKQALYGAQSKLPDSSRRKLEMQDRRPQDTLGIDSLAMADSLFRMRDSLPYGRYEDFLFSHSLPSAFFDKQGTVSAEYPIKADDELVLSLWGAVEKEYSLKVNSQGKVFVEGIGLLSVSGQTLGQAERSLKSKLSSVYGGISSGRISVNLRPESMSANKVFVVGDVKRPGGYDLPAGSNVFLALYRALGPNHIGSVRSIKVRRANGDSVTVDLYALLFKGQRADHAVLRDGDLVFVPRATKLVKAQGEVGRPAIYELTESEGVSELLLYAGGANPRAGHTLSLWRAQEDGRLEVRDLLGPKAYMTGGKQELLQDGDSLLVRSSTVESQGLVEVFGAVWYPGSYQLQPGSNVKQLVDQAGGLSPDGYAQRVVIQRIQPDSSFAYLADSYESPMGVPILPKDKLIVLSNKELNKSKLVSVAGAVNQDTSVVWAPGLTVKNMIALAKGFRVNHAEGVVLIERLIPGKEEVSVLRRTLKSDLTLEETPDLTLEPGDRVVVPVNPEYYEQELVTVAGAVRNPGTYALVKNRENVTDFVKRVVTFNGNAFLKGGRLYRKRGNGRYLVNFDFSKAVKGKLDEEVTLMHGDSLYVPEQQLTVQIRGEVVSPGDVLWVEGWDVDDYINAAGGLNVTGDEDRIVVTYANGAKSNSERAKRDPDPGSVIEVAYIKPPEPVQWTQVVAAFGTIVTGIAAFIIAYATMTGKT